jgi:hypothetical protein
MNGETCERAAIRIGTGTVTKVNGMGNLRIMSFKSTTLPETGRSANENQQRLFGSSLVLFGAIHVGGVWLAQFDDSTPTWENLVADDDALIPRGNFPVRWLRDDPAPVVRVLN